jgi:hypothetical protein
MVSFERLGSIAKAIIDSDDLAAYLRAAKDLSGFYSGITADNSVFNLSGSNEIFIKGGQALSTLHASACTDDYLRTVFFIKGVYKAVSKLLADHPLRTINIVYAGCGPFATLLLPLLPLFDKHRIEAVLIDINDHSIESVRHLLPLLGLEDYRLTLIEVDATAYTKPEDWEIDLLVTETMHYALTSEPQVSVTKNFMSQLKEHSILIPQQIHIDLCYSFYAKEPFLRNADGIENTYSLHPYPDRQYVDRLFSVNKNLGETIGNATQIETVIYTIPDNFEAFPDICLFTEVQVFDDVKLGYAQSLITNPYCVTSLYNLQAHPGFRLVYDFSETPKWTCVPVSP